MSDDLLDRLRSTGGDACRCGTPVCLEAANRIEQLEAALTPSGETKADYIGEFFFRVEGIGKIMVPWTTIKEIMAAIRSRAALGEKKDD